MAGDAIFTDDDFAEAQQAPVLGPAYFSARRYVERSMAGAEPDIFKPIIDKAVENIRHALWDDVETFLLADTESNLQGTMWRTIDATVQALLTGEKWAIERYAIGDRYDAKAVREAVIHHAPPALWDKRVTELQAEVDLLREQLKTERERNRERY